MSISAPHFLLHTEALPAEVCTGCVGNASATAHDDRPESATVAGAADSSAVGRWRFVLTLPSGETSLEAGDAEQDASSERLELLALVRGLEALEQPSRVTLVTAQQHIRRGLDFGLAQWRENGWHWERYGRMTPVKNGDLWRRIDRLLDIHQLDCRAGRLHQADDLAPPPAVRMLNHRGRKLRIDEPAAGSRRDQNTSTKLQTNSKSVSGNARVQGPRSKVQRPVELFSLALGALSRLVRSRTASR